MPTSRLTKAHSASLIFGFVLAATILFPVTIVAFQKGEPEKSIAELVDQLDTTALRRHFFAHVLNNDFERILLQIVSRGGPDAEAHLKAKLKHDENQITELRAEMEKRGNNSREPDEFLEMEYTLVDRLCNNLELLTALRRVQNKPDPLVIELELPKELHATTRSLPTITATLNSADVERIPIWLDLTPISHGSHRQAQWLFEVTDETGTLLPTRAKTRRSIEIAAANKADGPLSFGKSVQSRLPMSDFVNIRKPGDYMVKLVYHPKLPIADYAYSASYLSQLIVFESPSFQLKVVQAPKRMVWTGSADRETTMSLIDKLPEEGPIRIADGDYGPSVHDFISPDSPEGGILMLGWRAVPGLLDAVNKPDNSTHRNAWLLSLLYMITRERDLNPMQVESALPGFERRQGKYHMETLGGGKVFPAQQKWLIVRWNRFRNEYLDIRETAFQSGDCESTCIPDRETQPPMIPPTTVCPPPKACSPAEKFAWHRCPNSCRRIHEGKHRRIRR